MVRVMHDSNLEQQKSINLPTPVHKIGRRRMVVSIEDHVQTTQFRNYILLRSTRKTRM